MMPYHRAASEISRQTVDIVVLLDLSKSMLGKDLQISRMDFSRRLLNKLIKTDNNFAIFGFAGKTELLSPLSSNKSGLRLVINNLSSSSIPVGGSKISDAFQQIENRMSQWESKERLVLFLSDGESIGESDMDFSNYPWPIVTIGLGDPIQGSLLQNEDGTLIKKDGKAVRSWQNVALLKRIASESNGRYIHAKNLKETEAELMMELSKYSSGSIAGTKNYSVLICILLLAFLCSLSLLTGRAKIRALATALFLCTFPVFSAESKSLIADYEKQIQSVHSSKEEKALAYNNAAILYYQEAKSLDDTGIDLAIDLLKKSEDYFKESIRHGGVPKVAENLQSISTKQKTYVKRREKLKRSQALIELQRESLRLTWRRQIKLKSHIDEEAAVILASLRSIEQSLRAHTDLFKDLKQFDYTRARKLLAEAILQKAKEAELTKFISAKAATDKLIKDAYLKLGGRLDDKNSEDPKPPKTSKPQTKKERAKAVKSLLRIHQEKEAEKAKINKTKEHYDANDDVHW
ncbi:MAG: VWA domain-containing protein [Lentisphaeria bacterium]|nr:VWA domain-containing protein [Lentisphaeria bacterium]